MYPGANLRGKIAYYIMIEFSKERTPAEAAKAIISRDWVYIHGTGATPAALVQAMIDRADELNNIEIYHLHTEGEAKYLEPQYEDKFHLYSMFLVPNSPLPVNDGRADFIPCLLREGGKPIIALPSTTKYGDSKIVVFLKEGAGVVTTRAHFHYVVTEYGEADLYGRSLKLRARLLIDIAHPDHRESLERAAFVRFKKKDLEFKMTGFTDCHLQVLNIIISLVRLICLEPIGNIYC